MRERARCKITRNAGAAMRVGAVALGMAVVAGMGGCESVSKPGGGDEAVVQIRVVVVLRTPFYTSFPGDDSIPFVYLTEGTAVQWLKEKKSFAKVKLGNGSSGWVPSASLGETSFGRPEDLVQPESLPTQGAVDGASSAATQSAPGDDRLNRFNRP